MRFKLWILCSVLLAGSGCGSKVGVLGTALTNISALYSSSEAATEIVYVYDKPSSRILQVNLADMAVVKFFDASRESDDHSVAAHPAGNYVLDFSKKHLEIIRRDGSRQAKPFSFQGTPTSAAYNSQLGYFAMQDDLESIGLMALATDGTVASSWLGGPLVGEGKSILAGDIDQSGRLIFAVTDDSIVVTDFASSIAGKAWSSQSYASGINSMNWVAPDRTMSKLALVVGDKKISVVDNEALRVAESLDLTLEKQVIGKSKGSQPHVIILDVSSNIASIVYVGNDGAMVVSPLPAVVGGQFSSSFLSFDKSTLTIVGAAGRRDDNIRIVKLRLSDNLALLDKQISKADNIQLNDQFAFIKKDSVLGYLQQVNLENSAVKEIRGYNVGYFQNK